MNLRPARPDDSGAIHELVCELENSRFDRAEFERLYTGNLGREDIHYLVAEEEGEVVGFISLHGQVLLHHMDKVFEIQELVVDGDHRNRMIGASLVREAERVMREKGHRFVEVTTNVKREAAHRFYEKCGYAWTHRKYTKTIGAGEVKNG